MPADPVATIRRIAKETLAQLQAYNWPGNIRELQNIVERALILCETDTFVVDDIWLSSESGDSSVHEAVSPSENREAEIIKATLADRIWNRRR
jgi:formate hydrogenlyase transcriptional activator